MTDRPTQTPRPDGPGRYEIRLTGRLDAHWASWFDGLGVTREADGTSVIRGPIPDQAALHGLLQRIRDLGLPLVSVIRLEPEDPDTTSEGDRTR